jgi:transcriptional regulator with XRE-family HTH domain
MTTDTKPRPETYTQGLGELIRAHRVYIGLSQRDMARRLDMARRDYQRVESGRDSCPPGLLTKVEALSDQFCHDVDLLLDEAERRKGLALTYEVDTRLPEAERDEWHRLVAGRAAVETSEDAPITLTVNVGKLTEERTA